MSRLYSPDQVAAPTVAFDYVLYLACLIFAVELGYIEYRFHLLRDQWDTWLLFSAMTYLAVAYRLDNRFVLSLGIATLGGWFGVRFSHLVVVVNEPFRRAGTHLRRSCRRDGHRACTGSISSGTSSRRTCMWPPTLSVDRSSPA